MMGNNSDKTFQLTVKKGEPTRSRGTSCRNGEGQGLYFLSTLDENIPAIVRTIYCFKSNSKGNEEASCTSHCQVIKKALSSVEEIHKVSMNF